MAYSDSAGNSLQYVFGDFFLLIDLNMFILHQTGVGTLFWPIFCHMFVIKGPYKGFFYLTSLIDVIDNDVILYSRSSQCQIKVPIFKHLSKDDGGTYEGAVFCKLFFVTRGRYSNGCRMSYIMNSAVKMTIRQPKVCHFLG